MPCVSVAAHAFKPRMQEAVLGQRGAHSEVLSQKQHSNNRKKERSSERSVEDMLS